MISRISQNRDTFIHGNLGGWIGAVGLGIVFIGFTAYMSAMVGDANDFPVHAFFILFYTAGGLSIAVGLLDLLLSRRYGQSSLELQPSLCVPGGLLTGVIHIPRPFAFRKPVGVRFACIRGAVKTLAQRTQVEELFVIWEADFLLDKFSAGQRVAEIPVYFKIPMDAKLSENSHVDGHILWQLQVKAKTGALPYIASFVVPVIAGHAPTETANLPDRTASLQAATIEPAMRKARHIRLSELAGNGFQCEFLAGRNKKMAMFLLLLSAGTATAAILIFHAAGEWGFPVNVLFLMFGIPFAAIATGLLGLCVYLPLEKVTTTIRHGTLSAQRSVLLYSKKSELTAGQIKEIKVTINGQINNSPQYAISAVPLTGKPLKLGDGLRDKKYAEWLAAEITKHLNR